VADVLERDSVSGFKSCWSDNRVTVGQLMDVVKLWLEKNPGKRHFSAPSLVAAALSEAFPCQK
jgi:hypothetical protein